MAGILLVILTILIGSRGGLVAGIFSFAVGYAMVAGSWSLATRSRSPSSSKAASSRYGRWFLYAPPALFGILVGIALLYSDRSTSFPGVMGQSVGDVLRVPAWPTVQSMIETYWIAEIGRAHV